MQRGFKTQCERLALDFRQDFKLSDHDPLDAWQLASSLGAEVLDPQLLNTADGGTIKRLLTKHKACWSAATVFDGNDIVIILNSAHSKSRQSNSLAHELSHIICSHEPAHIVVSRNGELLLHEYDQEQEEEATWMAGTLLLPRPALLYIAANKLDNADGAHRYGVSKQLLDWRLNATGVRRQARAWR